MRTRFLSIDFFNSAPIETLDEFLRFPIPQIPSPPPPSLLNSSENNIFHFINEDEASISSVSSQIDSVPIERALSKFFADVLPHHLELDRRRSPECSSDEKKVKDLREELEAGNQIDVCSEISEEEIGATGEGAKVFAVLNFEIPELDPFLGNACIEQDHKAKFFPEVSDAETSEDLLLPMLKVQDLCKIQQSLFVVENISLDYQMDQSNAMLEDGSSLKGQYNPCHSDFPLLEVDVSSLGIFSSISVDNEMKPFESIEPQNWWGKDESVFDGKELLQFMEFDILEYLSCTSLSSQCLEVEIACSNFTQEIELFSVIEYPLVVENSPENTLENPTQYQARPDNIYLSLTSPILYEDLQFIDLESSKFSEVFANIKALGEAETCQQMFCEASNVNNFNELIVSHELTLEDDSFKSLPVPMLSYSEKIKSVLEYFEETLAKLKPQPSFASDAIYLDWHIIEEGKCNGSKYSSCMKVLEELDGCTHDSNMNSFDAGMLILDTVFSDANPNIPSIKEDKENLNIPSGDISVAHVSLDETSSGVLNEGCWKRLKGESSCNINCNKVSQLIKSRSQSNNIDSFLNPLKSAVTKNHYATKAVDTKTTTPEGSASDLIAAHDLTVLQSQQWYIKLHEIRLCDDTVALLNDLSETYMTILESDMELRKRKASYLTADDFTLLTLPDKNLMDWIKEIGIGKTSLAHNDDSLMLLVTLYAIKKMAWYLCYYGIHATYLYIDKLHQSLLCSRSRISFLRGLVLDALEKVKEEVMKCHPSLSVIRDILQSEFRKNLRILIVAEQVFWWPLKMMLNSMEISSINAQLFHTHANQVDTCHECQSTDTVMEAMVHSDCCLVSLKHISASFPFNKFGIVLEYGGSFGTSRLSTISPKAGNFPILHFLKVDLENSCVSRALCKSVDILKCDRIKKDEDPQFGPILSENNQKLEELLNFVPVDECDMRSPGAANCFNPSSIPQSLPSLQIDTESTQVCANKSCFPDAVIVVNTQSVDNEMIISRRSTYQKILAMEKEGTQVVERDLDQPVDVIVAAAVCLVWYNCRNIGKKATASNKASSSLPSCIENIATNGLTSLSFSFSGCILVFEGESSFLGGVMELSDELYAAAASLGMDLQLFCSYSSEMTDEIILSCIRHSTKFARGLYPSMPESESLAESFLTKFPSLNPLSAHAILSSVGVLIEFLEWSPIDRVRAVQKYRVSDDSVALLNACCKYGEREDCKSGTTDCSSVSSAPDSDNCLPKSVSEMRKRKYTRSTLNDDMPVDELFQLNTSPLFRERGENPKKMYKPNNFWLSEDLDVFNEAGKSSLLHGDELFPQKPGLNINSKTAPSQMSKPCGFYMSKGRVMSEEMDNNALPANDAVFCKNQGLDSGAINKMDRWNNNNSQRFIQNFVGEVINIDDESPTIERSTPNFSGCSNFKSEIGREPAVGPSKAARKLAFDGSGRRTFPSSADINYDSDAFISTRSNRKNSRGQHSGEDDFPSSYEEFNEGMLLEHQNYLLKENKLPVQVGNTYKHPTLTNNLPYYGGTPLSNAIHFAQPYHSSPWTIEFLNRIREKSRLRQKSLPPDLAGPSVGYTGNISKVSKRRSPSILEFYKYQKGSNPNKRMEQKRQRHTPQPSYSLKNEKTLRSSVPAVTPIDKRARQTLSFATSGSGGQSKLVWGDQSTHAIRNQI